GGTVGSNSSGLSRVDIYDSSNGSWSTTELPHARWSMGATVVGGKAMFAGGTSVAGTCSDAIDIYDGSSWTSTTLPGGARETVAATTVGTKALFAGGNH